MRPLPNLLILPALLTTALFAAACDPPAEAALAPLEAGFAPGIEVRIDPELKSPEAYRCLARSLQWHDYDERVDVLARVTYDDDRLRELIVTTDPSDRVDLEKYQGCLAGLPEEEPGTRSFAARAERDEVEAGATEEQREAARRARLVAPVTIAPIPAFDGPLAEILSEEVLRPFRSKVAACHAAGWEPGAPKYTDILLGFAIGEEGKAVGLRAVTTINMNDGMHRCLQTETPDDELDEPLADPAVVLKSIEEHRRLTEVRIPFSFRYKGQGHVMREGEKSFTTFDFGL